MRDLLYLSEFIWHFKSEFREERSV